MILRAALLLVAPLSVPACRSPLDVGGLGDARLDAGADTSVGPLPDDVLDVLVLDDAPYIGTGEPLAGVSVTALDGRGVHEATTGADGRARVDGLDLTADPPDVTFAADGFALFTVVDLGRAGPLPAPLEIGLGAFEGCGSCRSGWPDVQGQVERLSAGSTVLASVPGSWGTSASERYFTPRDPTVPGPVEVRGVELLDDTVVGVAGPALMDDLEAAGPPLTFRAVTPVTAAIRLERAFDDTGPLSGLPTNLQVTDLNPQGRAAATLGAAATVALDQVVLSYADEADGVAGGWAEILANDGEVGTYASAPLEAGAAVLRLLEPPRLAQQGDVVLPGDELEVVDPDAPNQVHTIALADAQGLVWIAILTPGASVVRFPFPPPGRPGDLLRVAAATLLLDRDPWQGHAVLGPRARAPWWRSLAFDARRLATIQ